ncbi:hypothetical protein K3Z86_28965, partial [Pseudomonas aeruginosa]|nr:hypothetical protein [Pseudomonas aeruginosa]
VAGAVSGVPRALTLDLAEEECATLEAPLTARARTPRW